MDKNIEEELKPCPFCGGNAFGATIAAHSHIIATFMPDYAGGAFIECAQCGASIIGEKAESVIEAWNKRTKGVADE